jgi:hypothetical protein
MILKFFWNNHLEKNPIGSLMKLDGALRFWINENQNFHQTVKDKNKKKYSVKLFPNFPLKIGKLWDFIYLFIFGKICHIFIVQRVAIEC